jgi:hypothetical protein
MSGSDGKLELAATYNRFEGAAVLEAVQQRFAILPGHNDDDVLTPG